MTVREINGMSEWEFSRWIAFYDMSPWDEERDDLRMALICKTIIKSMTGNDVDIKKLMPKFGGKRGMSVDEIDGLRRSLEGKFLKGKNG